MRHLTTHLTTRFRPAVVLVGLLLAGVTVAGRPAGAQPTATNGTPVAVSDEVTVLADRLEEVGDVLIATGNAELTRRTSRLLADRVELDRQTGDAVATGNAILYDGDDRITAPRIDYNVRTGTGVVYDGEAHAAPYYRVLGERMERLDESRYVVSRGVFTTCEDDPPAWSFHFGNADVDLEDWLWGRNASFWVAGVPVIPFIPYFAAAIRRDRQSGFLFPKFGNSSSKGYYAEVPYYWAISDSQDLTVAPLGFSKRGVGATAEYRYILSALNRGRMSGFLLWEGLRDSEPAGVHDHIRGWGSIRHTWSIDPDLRVIVDLNGVTDDLVLKEYGDRLGDRHAQRVDSNLAITRNWTAWSLMANAYSYQDLTTRQPVELRRLPELRFDGMPQPVPGVPGVLFEMQSSAVNFVRDLGADGQRLDLHPRVSLPIPIYGTVAVTPFVGGRLTAYDRTVTGTRVVNSIEVETTNDDSKLRRLIEAGVDVDARASRAYDVKTFGVDSVMHVIEPKINYTWIAGSDLFRYTDAGFLRPNRLPQYQGGVPGIISPPVNPAAYDNALIDSIPQASRFTYSLTNRLLAKTTTADGVETLRWEAARFVLEHSYELDNPKRPLGDLFAQLILSPNEVLSFRTEATYSPYDGFQTGIADVALTMTGGRVALGTRFNEPNDVQFLQGSGQVEVTRFAALHGSTNWDIGSNTLVEGRIGLDLKWQCWAFTIEYVSRRGDEDEFRFALNLLGVGSPLTTSFGMGALGGGPGGSGAR